MNEIHSCFRVGLGLCVLILLCGGCNEQTTAPANHNPTVTSLVAFPDQVHSRDSFAVVCSAFDVDGDSLVYDWSCTSGASIRGGDPLVPWTLFNARENIGIFYAPDSANNHQDSIRIDVNVRDGKGGGSSRFTFVSLSK